VIEGGRVEGSGFLVISYSAVDAWWWAWCRAYVTGARFQESGLRVTVSGSLGFVFSNTPVLQKSVISEVKFHLSMNGSGSSNGQSEAGCLRKVTE
jgi:hypothetical protein